MNEKLGSVRVAIDVGGTFTDIAVLDESQGVVRFDKLSTTPIDPGVGVIDGFAKAGAVMGEVSYFVHGTTLALNALLTRTGARVALVTTRGFRDVHELGRTDRDEMYALTYRKPVSLVPRRLAFEVLERLDFEGNVVVPFDSGDAVQVAASIRESGVTSVAVCFLHSYANPRHEELMEEILRDAVPDVEVTLSHRLVREYREYERTSTAVIDAYIKPVVRRYLEHLRDSLAAGGFGGRFLVTRSGGGAMTVETAIEQPAHLVLSGPASGVIGAAAFAEIVNEPNLITIDMGGTSLDASLIVRSTPTTVTEARFQGHPIALPSLNIKTIGAGGGSIAWIDSAGHMQVGPHSAAAIPGPACYGRGGAEATVTDAALIIGYLGERTALGGELKLIPELAWTVIARVANELALDPVAVAAGIVETVTTRVTGAVREITVEQGHVPGDFALLAYGGGGGLIACDVARELGIPRVIVPPGPGAFSAFGMLLTDVVHDLGQTRVMEFNRIDARELESTYAELEGRGHAALSADGFAAGDMQVLRTADLRFAGQEHTVTVAIPPGRLTRTGLGELAETFGRLHQERYGHRMTDPVELVTARVRAVGRVPRPVLPVAGTGDPDHVRTGTRRVFRGGGAPMDYGVFARKALGRGTTLEGPAIVEEHTATTVLHAGDHLVVGNHGELVIAIGVEQPRLSDVAVAASATRRAS